MSLLRSHFPLLQRFAAFLALLAMLVPVGATLVHHPAAAQSFMRICSIASHNDNHSKSPAQHSPSCPICQSLHLLGGGFVPPADIVIAQISVIAPAYVFNDEAVLLKAVFAPQAQPRAPPALV